MYACMAFIDLLLWLVDFWNNRSSAWKLGSTLELSTQFQSRQEWHKDVQMVTCYQQENDLGLNTASIPCHTEVLSHVWSVNLLYPQLLPSNHVTAVISHQLTIFLPRQFGDWKCFDDTGQFNTLALYSLLRLLWKVCVLNSHWKEQKRKEAVSFHHLSESFH